MADTAQLTIGSDAKCTDGVCCEVSRVLVDPASRVVTHVVVGSKDPMRLGRLVPVDLLDTSAGEIHLRCTGEELEQLAQAEETQFLPGSLMTGYGPEQAFGLLQTVSRVVTYYTVPDGEVAVRRGDNVQATDGDIGRVHGLLIDPCDHRVTHVLSLEHQALGEKIAAIPIAAVIGVDQGIRLSITRKEVQDLPPSDQVNPQG